jgi:hypothetical protein
MTVHRIDASLIAPEVRAVKIGFGWFSKDAGGVTWAVKAVR